MNKFIATVIAMVAFAFATMAMVAPANATGNDQPADNKEVTFCHATGVDGKYNKITTSLNGFLNGHYDGKGEGHTPGSNQDIWPAFSYTTKGNEVVNIAANGDQTLLAFPDCVRPVTDTEIAVPAVTKVDKCGTDEDSVTPVTDDTKYTTEVGPRVNDSITVTFTAKDGFVFVGGDKVKTVTVNFPNNDDCDLPETGGAATYNTTLGGLALAGVAMLGLGMMFTRKRI